MSKIYDFDKVIDRRNTDSVKHERPLKLTGQNDLLPLWVADMDFATPPFVIDVIQKRLATEVLGYSVAPNRYFESVSAWCSRQYGMDVDTSHIHYVPGVVPGIYFAINAFTKEGDGVLIQQPVYHPFRHAICGSGRRCVINELHFDSGALNIDFEDFENKVKDSSLFILCHPHNPVGHEWTLADLQRMADICAKYGVMVVSDEIHADMMNEGRKHTPFAMVNDNARSNSITLMAPSKVFNMPGVVDSHAIVLDDRIRHKYFAYLDDNDVAFGNSFAYDCTVACYSDEGDMWRREMLEYVGNNFNYVISFLSEHCPKIRTHVPNASFLMWLDCRELKLTQEELTSFFINDAGLYLNDGTMFGRSGRGFMRLNVATPRSILCDALTLLAQAYSIRGF